MFIDPARPRSTSTPWSVESVEAQLSFLQGEVLTITEAALTGSQLKATKDLIKGAFRNRARYMRDLSASTVSAGAPPSTSESDDGRNTTF